jgi:Outer membrane protein beta-barrel domain
MKKFIRLFHIIVILTLIIIISACKTSAQNFQGGANFIIGFPQGQFKDKIDNNGYGIIANIGFAPQINPYMIGLEFAYMNYGSETRTEPFSTTIPDVFVDVNTTNNIVLGDLFLRLQPNRGFFQPYVEGLIGFSYLFTETKIENIGNANEEVASSTNFDDFAFNYGAGGGIAFVVYKSGDNENIGLREVLIDVGVKYIEGGEAEYLRKGSIRRENGNVIYDVNKSKTSLLTLQIGASARF